MRTYIALCFQLALIFGSALVLTAQTKHITPFAGTWKMNLAKSRFNSGPPFRSFTIRFTSDGARHLDWIDADGESIKASLPWSDGKEVSVEGMANTTATSKIQGGTFHDIWRQNGRVTEDVHGVMSPDGKTLKVTVDGIGRRGRTYHKQLTFDKQ